MDVFDYIFISILTKVTLQINKVVVYHASCLREVEYTKPKIESKKTNKSQIAKIPTDEKKRKSISADIICNSREMFLGHKGFPNTTERCARVTFINFTRTHTHKSRA